MKVRNSIFILMFCCFIKIYSIEDYQNLSDSYVQINVKNLEDNFFMIKYNEETDEVYVGLNSLVYFLELYSFNIDIEKRELKGTIDNKDIDVVFSDDESFILDGELYINIKVLEKKLSFKKTSFDYSSLRLNLEPKFTLPYEEREKGKLERLRLDSRKKETKRRNDIEIPRKLITPGLLKIGYLNNDLKEPEYRMNYEYSSQLLYGEFYIDGELKPERKINYGNLTYSDIYNGNDLVLGHFSLKTPNFININSKTLGLSFDNSDVYMTNDSGVTIIRGEAKNAETIELYRNYFLVDYIKPFSENYEFRIDDGVFNSNYTVKIYYEDGKIEEKRVYSLSDINLLKKGKNRVSYQIGENEDNDFVQSIGKVYYGLTDNITLGLGGMNLKSTNRLKYEIIENDILMRIGNKSFPMLINYKNYYDHTHEKNNYELEVEQKIFSYSLKFIENKYSDVGNKEIETKKYNSVSIGKGFNRNFYEFGVEKILKFGNSNGDNSEKNIYGVWDSSWFSSVYTSLKIEKNIDGDNEKIAYKPSISYSNYDNITLVLDGSISKDNRQRRYDQEYSLKVNLKKQELIEDTLFADVGMTMNYSNETNKFRYGFTFSIELDDYLYIKSPTTTTISENGKEKTQTGLEISKIIDLSNPKRKIKKNISLNSSWLHGKVFLDRNGNGKFDVGEPPLENVRVMVNNKQFYSDKNGDYVAEGFYNNEEVILTVDRRTIDPMMKNSRDSLKIKTRRSSGAKVDIPVETISMVMGNILYTDDFTEKEFIRNISMTTIMLEKNGEVVKEIDPEFDGMYFFEDVTPGEYTIRFEYIGEDNIGFSQETIPLKVLLNNPDEGEYFEGYDTKLMRIERSTKIDDEDLDGAFEDF